MKIVVDSLDGRAHAVFMSTMTGYRVSATVLGRVKSIVFSTRAAAETFVAANAHRESAVDIVALDANGKIVKQCSCGNATDPHRGFSKQRGALERG
jgi:hypothetical protein